MDLFGVFDISSAGMSVEQSRLAVAASNMANARTSSSADGSPYQPLTAVVNSVSYANVEAAVQAEALPRPVVQEVVTTNDPPRMVYDPGHPDADERGFVTMPGVDPLSNMLELISVSRNYEANLRAFDVTRHLIQRTLDMGNSR